MAKKASKKVCYNLIEDADVQASPHCCGVTEIGDFGDGPREEYPDDNYYYENRPRNGKKVDYSTQRNALDAVCEGGNGLVIATTVPRQKDAIAALRATGFRVLTTFIGLHGTRITMWGHARGRGQRWEHKGSLAAEAVTS